jgi:hypothetical protein
MARPIKETPILKGQDAKKFFDKMNTAADRKSSPQKLAEMKENFYKMKFISKF